MSDRHIEVLPVTPQSSRQAAQVLGRAFLDDPVSVAVMHSIEIKPAFLLAVLAAWGTLFFSVPAQASSVQGKNGSVILRMCKGADTVRALSVMCHSYHDGYIDAAHHYGKGKAAFCLDPEDKKKAPGALVEWIELHPDSLNQPAAEVMQKALTERFPCKGGK